MSNNRNSAWGGTGGDGSTSVVGNPNAIPAPGSPVTNNVLVWNGATWVSQFAVNANIDPAAAIAYSKLNLASSIVSGDIVDGTIVNADINASAAIVASKILGGVGLQQLADSTAGGTVATIDFSSISSSYAHLLVTGIVRGDNAGSQNLSMRFNNDSAANYDFQLLSGNAATASATESLGQTALRVGGVPGTGATANYFSVFAAFIPQYAGSTADKEFVSISTLKTGTGSGGLTAAFLVGGWRTTGTAINRLTFLPATGNFVAGSRITVYGLS